ncbi:MAG: VWA domain-containing protein, partial [Pseudomonadota bacterium]
MLTELFYNLKKAQIPVSVTEYLTLLGAMEKHLAGYSTESFYYLARTALIKDERFFDRFDQIFSDYIQGKESIFDEVIGEIPLEWLQKQKELNLSDEEKQQIESLGGWEKLMETLRERLEEQKKEHHGGSKMIGTGGTSPFGANGYNPEGVRIGQKEGRQGRAVKVWDKRQYQNLDDSVELGTRNIKIALRQLRRFAREGGEDELDLDDTIGSTAKNAGLL